MQATLLQIETPKGAWCQGIHGLRSGTHTMIDIIGPQGGDSCTELATLRGLDRQTVETYLASRRDVLRHEVVDEGRHHIQVRVVFRGCPLARVVSDHQLVPRLPFQNRAGSDLWIIIGQRPAIVKTRRHLAALGLNVETLHERDWEQMRDGLTPRQQELLHLAALHGYYDYPRRTTLSALAERLGIAKSTLSEALMVVEKKLVAQHMRPRSEQRATGKGKESADDDEDTDRDPIQT